MTKQFAALIVLVIVALLSVAGCITFPVSTSTPSPTATPMPKVTTPTPTQTPAASVSPTRNALLEKFVTAQRNYTDQNWTFRAWQVTWPSSNEVNIQAALDREQPSATSYISRTMTGFPSTEAATAYLNNYNLTGYVLSYTSYPSGGPTEIALGHQPIVFKAYEKISDESGSHYSYQVEQADNLILVSDLRNTPY